MRGAATSSCCRARTTRSAPSSNDPAPRAASSASRSAAGACRYVVLCFDIRVVFQSSSARGRTSDESRRRRGCNVDIPWRRAAATPRRPRGRSSSARGHISDHSRRRRGYDVDIPWRRVPAALVATPPGQHTFPKSDPPPRLDLVEAVRVHRGRRGRRVEVVLVARLVAEPVALVALRGRRGHLLRRLEPAREPLGSGRPRKRPLGPRMSPNRTLRNTAPLCFGPAPIR